MAGFDASSSMFIPCKLLVYGAPKSGRRTLITRLLHSRCLSDWTVEDRDLLKLDGDNVLALSPIPLCGTSVQLICVKNPKADKHRDAVAAAVLYDITNEASLRYAERFIMEVQHSLPSVPVFLVGNKLDLKSSSSLAESSVQTTLAVLWSSVHSHCQLSAQQGHGITSFLGTALAIPFLQLQHSKIGHRAMDWNVMAEQAMLWAFDHSMDSVVCCLKSMRMPLTATVVQLHGAAVERHLHRVCPWRAVNVAAAQQGKSCRRIWKSQLTVQRSAADGEGDEIGEEEKEIMLAMLHGTVLVHEQQSPVTGSDAWQAIDVDSDGDDAHCSSQVMGCCVQWGRLMLETFMSSWLTKSCTGLSKEAITHMNLSANRLTFLPLDVYNLPSLVCLAAADNLLTELPDAAQWAASSKLQFLDLSGNRIFMTAESELGCEPRHGKFSRASNRRDAGMTSTLNPTSSRKRPMADLTRSLSPNTPPPVFDDARYSLAPALWYIDLSRNKLQHMPLWILRLPSLAFLDLSHNKLHELPASLTALTSLQELRVTDVANIPQHIISSGSASLLGHLGLAHHRRAVTPSSPSQSNAEDRRLQIVTFGPKDSGKTALLAQLTGKRFDIADPATHCLTNQQWTINSPERLRFFRPPVYAEVWDFSGSELCQPLHASIGSRYALYVAVCSMVDLRHSCQRLARYLVQLQTLHSHPLAVVVVFTHYDLCGNSRSEREAEKRQCLNWVARLMDDDEVSVDGVTWPSSCRPKLYGTVFVASPNRTGISELHSLIYITGVDMTSPQGAASEASSNVTLPLHCIQTERCIKQWLATAEGFLSPMLISGSDLWQRLHQQKSLTLTKTEFINALTLLGTLGLCVYFPPTPSSSHTTGLFVMDVQRMCSMIADVLRLTERLSRTADDPSGFFQQSHLSMILAKYFPESCGELDDRLPVKYLSVLESVGICRTLSDGTLFLPSGLALSFADASLPLTWTDKSVARLFRISCLSSTFWSLLLQRLACQLEAISQLYASCERTSERRETLSGLHHKATFWRTGMLLLGNGCQVLVRATPASSTASSPARTPSAPGTPTRSGSPTNSAAPLGNEIDVLVEGSDNLSHVKLLQAITQAILETMKQCSRSVPMEESRGVLQCLIVCPVCRGSTPRSHSLYREVYPASFYHFSLTTCVMALDAQAEEEDQRRRHSPSSSSASSGPVSMAKFSPGTSTTSSLYGSLGCGKHRLLVPLQQLIPDVVFEDLKAILAAGGEGVSAQGQPEPLPPKPVSLPRFITGPSLEGGAMPDIPKTISRHFFTAPPSLEVDCLLQPYHMLRWRAEALLLIQKEGLCPRPGSLTSHPPVLRLLAPFRGSLASRMGYTGRGFKRKQAHVIGFQIVDGLRHLLSKGLVHCNLSVDSIYLHNGSQLRICLSDNGIRPLRNNDDLQEMFVQLGVVLYELVCGEKLLCGVMTTSQLVLSFRNRRLRPSLENLLLDIVPLPKDDGLIDRQNLQPHQQSRRWVERSSNDAARTRRCNSEGTRRPHSMYVPERRGRVRSNSDVSSVTHTVIDRLLTSCSRLCLQAVMEKCWSLALVEQIGVEEVLDALSQSLTLCCCATQWSPACIQHRVTAMAHYGARRVVVWATAVPRLHLGKLDLRTGLSAPQPLSFLPDTMPHLRNRHVAVRSEERVMCMAIAERVGQLWVCVERNTSGALYVFDLATLEVMDSVDFDDGEDSAVLSAVAVPTPPRPSEGGGGDGGVHGDGQEQLVLVGLACGSVLVFLAKASSLQEDGQSPLKQCVCRLESAHPQPCMVIGMGCSPSTVLCAFGASLCPLEVADLEQLARAQTPEPAHCVFTRKLTEMRNLSDILVSPRGKSLLDRRFMRSGIMRLLATPYGVWLVQRHSHLVILLDADLKTCKLLLDVRNVCGIDDNARSYVLCMAVTGPMLWLGTRGGHVMLLNIPKALKFWTGKEVVREPSVLLGLRQPLPNCRVFSLVAMADGALLSADAGGHAQAVCAVERCAATEQDTAGDCVGVFVVDIAVDALDVPSPASAAD